MARRQRVAYRKKYQNRISMCLVSVVVIMIMIMVQVKNNQLQQKIDVKNAELQLLEAQIEEEKQRQAEIEEFGKEVQTKGYIENIAREKLGLVYEDEILFKEEK